MFFGSNTDFHFLRNKESALLSLRHVDDIFVIWQFTQKCLCYVCLWTRRICNNINTYTYLFLDFEVQKKFKTYPYRSLSKLPLEPFLWNYDGDLKTVRWSGKDHLQHSWWTDRRTVIMSYLTCSSLESTNKILTHNKAGQACYWNIDVFLNWPHQYRHELQDIHRTSNRI